MALKFLQCSIILVSRTFPNLFFGGIAILYIPSLDGKWEIHFFLFIDIFLIDLETLVTIFICIYPTPLPWEECDKKSDFKHSSAGLEIRFPSLRLVALSKYTICPTIDPLLVGEQINLFLSKNSVMCKRPYPGFELGLLISFLKMVTIILTKVRW